MSTSTRPAEHGSDGLFPPKFITMRLARLHGKLSAQAAAVLAEHTNLSVVQLRILAQVIREGDNAISSDIAMHMGMDRGLLSRTLKNLMQMGYIEARTDDVDRRRHYMSITAAGRAEHDRVVPLMYRRHEHLLNDLSAAEQETLFDALDKLEAASARRDFND